MKVALLTTQQKDELVGQSLQHDWYFNPVQDADGNWIISTEEIDANQNSSFDWITELQLIDWNPPALGLSI
jgi:hypothetical protein